MTLAELPLFSPVRPSTDWLVHPTGKAGLYRTGHPEEITLSNGLIARTFRLGPNAATVGLRNLMTGEEMLRAVKPEAIIEVDGKRREVGGLKGQPDLAYLTPEWLDKM